LLGQALERNLGFQKRLGLLSSMQLYALRSMEALEKNHWMTESHWYEVSYSLFARLFRFGQKDASRPKNHLALKLEAKN
jgi:hypothetical protein